MDYKKFYKEINIKKQLNELSKKHRNIIIYGAGAMSNALFKEYKEDLEKFNIVAICDKKFEEKENETYFGYPAISADRIENFEFDAVLVNLKNTKNLIISLQDRFFDTKNEKKYVGRIYKIPFLYYLKYILC